MTSEDVFGLVCIFYAVANLASMGLELKPRETMAALRSVKVISITLILSWIVGPAIGVLLSRVLPMSDAYAMGMVLFSLAPTAPALPLFVRLAKADISLAAAIMPMAVVGTVILMPLMAPLLMDGLTVNSWEIAKPLLLTVLLPLVVGVVLKVRVPDFAEKIFPAVKKLAGISTLLLLVFAVVVHFWELVSAVGSWAIGGQILFTLLLAVIGYCSGIGFDHTRRSALSLSICTRNGGAMFVALTAFPNPEPQLLVMVLLSVPVPAIVWFFIARFLAARVTSSEDREKPSADDVVEEAE